MENAINTTVTEAGLKQLDKLIEKLEMAEAKFDSTTTSAMEFYKTLSTPPKTSDALNKQLLESDRLVKLLQSDNKKLQDSYDALVVKTNKLTEAKKSNTKALTDNSINQSILLKNVKEEEVLTSNLTTYIQKLSVERLRAGKVVADYNAQISMGTQLTEQQTAELATATAQFTKYDNAIKAGKKSIGDAREYVGQYERANWGLNNSINQLTRELPALGINASTFFLAISNNIPMLKDAIDEINIKNKNLAAQGKATTSVWSQLSSAFFSWNTLLSVSVTLLVVYGKEIGQFAQELLGASTALDEVNKRQKEFNQAKITGRKDAQAEILELRKYLAVVNDRKLSDEQRKIAQDALLKQYPYYIRSVKDAMLVDGQYSQGVKELIIALEKRKEVEKKSELNVTNKQKLIDLQNEYELNKENLRILEENFNAAKKSGGLNAQSANIIIEEKNKLTQRNLDLNKQMPDIQKSIIKNDADIINLKKETIGLEYQETKATDDNTRSIKLNTKAREDYLASEYELWKLRKENESSRNKAILEDQSSGYAIRLAASEQYYANERELAERAQLEQKRVLELETQEKYRINSNEYYNYKESLEKQLNSSKATSEQKMMIEKELSSSFEQHQKDMIGISYDATNKRLIIEENFNQRIFELNVETIQKLKKEWDDINFGKAKIEIDQRGLDQIDAYIQKLSNLNINASSEEIKSSLEGISQAFALENAKIALSEASLNLDVKEAEKARLQEKIDALNKIRNLSSSQVQEQKINNEALLKLDDEIINSKKDIGNATIGLSKIEIEQANFVKEKKKQILDETKDLYRELYSSLTDLVNTVFEAQVSSYDKEIQRSNEHFDALIANAEDGSAQQIALQEEKAKKEEELQKRKIDLQRKQAIFNKLIQVAEIVASTATAVAKIQLEAAILRANPLTAGLAVLALSQIPIVLGTSAAQVLTVMATPLPQYEKGRIGGKAETAIVHGQEVIEKPDGSTIIAPGKKGTPSIMNLGFGDNVHKSMDDYKNSKVSLQNASIMASFAGQNAKTQVFDYYIMKELQGVSDKIEKGIKRGFKDVRINNQINNNIDIGHLNYKNRGLS